MFSTDPARSLSDSFDQDWLEGMLVPVQGFDSPLFGLKINPEKAREELRFASQKHADNGVKDFMDSMGLGMLAKQLKKKIASATSAIKLILGKEEAWQDATDKLEQLRERVAKVQELFRDSKTTEFVIVMIPTVMAVSESLQLHASLKKENDPVQRLIVNQDLPPCASDCKFCAMKRKPWSTPENTRGEAGEYFNITNKPGHVSMDYWIC